MSVFLWFPLPSGGGIFCAYICSQFMRPQISSHKQNLPKCRIGTQTICQSMPNSRFNVVFRALAKDLLFKIQQTEIENNKTDKL